MPDASALVESLLRTERGRRSDVARRLSRADLHVPALCDVEVVSTLRRGLLAGKMTLRRAREALEDLRDLPLTRHGHLALLPRVLELRHNLSAYDATYVALAEWLEGSFLTGDRPLGRAVEKGIADGEVRIEECVVVG